MTTVPTNNKGIKWYDLKEKVREIVWSLYPTKDTATIKNFKFASRLHAFDPDAKVVVYPFADNCGGFATLVEHTTLQDVVVVDVPWHPTGTAA